MAGSRAGGVLHRWENSAAGERGAGSTGHQRPVGSPLVLAEAGVRMKSLTSNSSPSAV